MAKTLLVASALCLLCFVHLCRGELSCYQCDEDNYTKDFNCTTTIISSPAQSGLKHYCVTDYTTYVNGATSQIILSQFLVNSSDPTLSGKCVEGPLGASSSTELKYATTCYCDEDLCNDKEYEPPPAVEYPIKCYMCESLEDSCQLHPHNLVELPSVPYHHDLIPLTQFRLDDLPSNYSTYCVEKVFKFESGVTHVHRGGIWLEDSKLNGTCEDVSGLGYKICYCNHKDGCNDSYKGGNGAMVVTGTVLVFVSISLLLQLLA